MDRAALDVAMELGIGTGGWCPQGRRAEDGVVPAKYSTLEETESRQFAVRTARNIRDSEATLIINEGPLSGGTAMTYHSIGYQLKKRFLVQLDSPAPNGTGEWAPEVREWLTRVGPKVLNIAGPRESKCPGIGARAAVLLREALGSWGEIR